MIIYGTLGARWAPNEWYLGEQVSYKNPMHREVLLKLWDQMAQCGVDGLMFKIDDIPLYDDPEKQGREHAEWLRRVKEIAAKHGIERVMTCPTHYWRGWHEDYFKPFKEAEDLADLRMYFCPYAADEIARVETAGLRNYEWWYNGVHPFDGLKSGIQYMEYGWYGAKNERVAPELWKPTRPARWYGGNLDGVLCKLRTLPDRTMHAWLCGGGDTGLPVWGAYLWDPAAYETESMQRTAAEVLFGRGAAAPMMTIRKHMETWSTRVRNRDGDADEMRRSEIRAREALERLKVIVKQEERPGLLSPERQQAFCELYEEDFAALWKQADTVAVETELDWFVDSIEVVLTTALSGSEIRYTLDGSEPAADSPVYTKPLVLSETTEIKARAFRDGRLGPTTTQTVTKIQVRPAEQPGEVAPGLRFEYYEGEWEKLPDFDALQPVAQGIAETFDIIHRERDDRFAFRFTGYIKVPREGVYRFFVRGDDGVKLWLGGDVVIDDDGIHGAREVSEYVALAAGLHPITVTYFELAGVERLDVGYEGPGIEKQIVPAEMLFHKTGDADSR